MNAKIRTDIKGVDRFIFESGSDPDKLHFYISEVAPGTRVHSLHQHVGKEIFYVFSGESEVVCGDKTHQLTTN